MWHKILLGWMAAVCIAATAAAQATSVDLDVSAAFLSKYIWNGFDRIEGHGLDRGPVLQPKVSVGMGNSPLKAFVGGSFVINEESELHETTYGVFIERFSSPFTKLVLGYAYYDDRVVQPEGLEDADFHQIWADLRMRNPVGVETSLGLEYEISARSAYDPYWVYHADLTYTSPLVPGDGVVGMGLDLRSFTRVLYNSHVEKDGLELVRRGFSAWQLGMALDLRAARVTLSPSINYQFTLEESVNGEDPLWGGITMAYTF